MKQTDNQTLLQIKRKEKKLSLDAMAELVGIKKSTLSRIEKGQTTPSKDNARTLFHFFNKKIPLGQIYDPEMYDAK